MGWQEVARAEQADNRLDFTSVSDRRKLLPDSPDNRPLRPAELERVTQIALSSSPQKTWNQALREYLLNRPRPEEYEDTLPDRIPVPGGQTIAHLQTTINGEPSRTVERRSLYARDASPAMRRIGRLVDDVRGLEADLTARLDRFEARHSADVPNAYARQTAQRAERERYTRKAMFSQMVKKYVLEQMKKGRHLSYEAAERECKALARK